MSSAAQADVRCLALNAIAANSSDDAEVKRAATVGIMYFLGKLRAEAPTLNLADAIEQEANAFAGNPKAKEIGAACDAEIQTRGRELIDLGQELQKRAQSSSSS